MKIPAALHPGNHFHVQCLLLRGSLCSEEAAGSAQGRRKVLRLARALAFSPTALEDAPTRARAASANSAPQSPRETNDISSDMILPEKTLSMTQWRSVTALLRGLSDNVPPVILRRRTDQQSTPPTPTDSTTTVNNEATARCFSNSPQMRSFSAPSLTAAALSVRELAFTPPARLVPLYAPRTLLPDLPLFPYHDDVTYDAALHHAAVLSQLLQPYGVEVCVTGALRRGCPVAAQAEYLLALTEAATAEVEAVQAMADTDKTDFEGHWMLTGGADGNSVDVVENISHVGNEGVAYGDALGRREGVEKKREEGTDTGIHATSTQRLPQRRSARNLHRDAFTIPLSPSLPPPSLCDRVSGLPPSEPFTSDNQKLCSDARTQPPTSPFSTWRTLRCPSADAFAASDNFSPQVAFRLRRGLQALIQHGYIVAGRVPPLSASALSRRPSLAVSVRYDTLSPTRVPSVECADPDVLARLQLHRIVLHFCPWQARATRQLFLTGPPAFTAHVVLRALAHGVDLNMNGAFLCLTTRTPSPPALHDAADGLGGEEVAAHSAGAVNPAFVKSGSGDGGPSWSAQDHSVAQKSDVEQVIVSDEASLFEIAGMPDVDPVLRAVYCEVNGLR